MAMFMGKVINHMGVSVNGGYPHMAALQGEIPSIKMDDPGVPPFVGNPHMILVPNVARVH